MISPIYIFFLMFFHIIKNIYSQGTTHETLIAGLGQSACVFYGTSGSGCPLSDVDVNSLPTNCSSYLYMGFIVDNGVLSDTDYQYGYLEQLLNSSEFTGVYVYYFHGTQMQWCTAVAADIDGKTTEMNNLKNLLDANPGVNGLILSGLLEVNTEVSSVDCPNYSQNLKSYIELMRTTFTNMEVGISISAKRAREWYDNPNLAWLDYSVLGTSVSFYVIDFQDLNKCSDEFTKTGCYPVSGNSNNTLDKMKTFLENTGVRFNVAYYSFYTFADLKNESRICDENPTTYCHDVPDANTSMCMDTLQTLYDKGVFTKNNAAGFAVTAINLDDFDSTCDCGQSFPAFYALFNGYMGNPPPQPCALFDRT